METSIVTERGRLAIPANIRRSFNIEAGTRVVFVVQDGQLILQPLDKHYFEGLSGVLGTRGRVLKSLIAAKRREREN